MLYKMLRNTIGDNDQTNHCFELFSEAELQVQVVRFLRKKGALFSCTLGGFLDTDQKRVSSQKQGYLSGIPDLMIYSKNTKWAGLGLELKAPQFPTCLSEEQKMSHVRFVEQGWLIIVSNNFAEIIEIILDFLADRN
jgi:hypothetical protein